MKCYWLALFSLVPWLLSAQDSLSVSNITLESVEVVGENYTRAGFAPALRLDFRDQPIHLVSQATLSDALNTLPGLFVQEGAFNTQRITARGMGNRSPFSTTRIRAYADNIPLTNGSGETLLEDFAPGTFGYAQFIKGPRATRYGTPLGGNLLLRSLPDLQNRRNIHLDITLGSFGFWQVGAEAHLISKNEDQHRFVVNATHSDGYRDNNRYDRQQLLYSNKITYGNDRHETRILFAANYLVAQIPSSLGETDYRNDPRKAAFPWGQIEGFEDYYRLIGGLTHRVTILDRDRLQLENTTSLFGQFRSNYELRPFNLLEERNGWYGARSLFTLQNRDHWAIVLGGELFLEDYAWTTTAIANLEPDTLLSDNRELRRHLNLFLESELHFGPFSLVPGIGLQFSRYDYSDRFQPAVEDLSADFSFAPIFSPSLTLEYRIGRGLLYANVSRGFALPTLEETLLPDGQRNPDIRPETGWNFEAGLEQNLLFDRLSFNLVLYHMRVEDLLVARRTALDAFTSVNAGSTTHTGLEAGGQFLFVPSGKLRLLWTYNWSFHQFEEFVDDQDDFSGNALTGTPPHQLRLALEARLWKRVFLQLQYRFVDAFPMNDANTAYSDAYQLLDLNLEYDWHLEKDFLQDLVLFLSLQNLTDNRQYAPMISVNAVGFGGNEPRYYYPGLPFNLRGGISLKW